MNAFASLSNRIFLTTAVLAVVSIGAAIYIVNRAVSKQTDAELQRGITEAATLVDEYRKFSFENFGRDARLIADLPKLKAAVYVGDPNVVTLAGNVKTEAEKAEAIRDTLEPIAREYRSLVVNADLFAIADSRGRVLVRLGTTEVPDAALALASIDWQTSDPERDAFWPGRGGLVLIKSVPIWIESGATTRDVLGTLILGANLDNRQVTRFKNLTQSEIAFGVNGQILAATLPADTWPALGRLLNRPGTSSKVQLGDDEYLAFATPLAEPGPNGQPMALVLRSQAQSLGFVRALHTQLALTAMVAVLIATIFSYAIARTITRPLGTITSTMREMAKSGDLSRRIPMPDARWQDEDARLLATTFNSMTDSIERFQRDATQRERLSSLGRLSTVIAHEIRNPLMIMKTSLRILRREDARPQQVRAATADIDEEVTRLNRIVTEVLDFARPINFEVAPADLNALARDAVRAAEAAAGCDGVRLALDTKLPPAQTDAERLRQALVNIIGNAIQAVEEVSTPGGEGVRIRTARLDPQHAVITVSDSGRGIAATDLPRVFEPYFTTRRTGTGIGLAISRNIIEGLGGRITVASEPGRGTDVRIELPLDGPTA